MTARCLFSVLLNAMQHYIEPLYVVRYETRCVAGSSLRCHRSEKLDDLVFTSVTKMIRAVWLNDTKLSVISARAIRKCLPWKMPRKTFPVPAKIFMYLTKINLFFIITMKSASIFIVSAVSSSAGAGSLITFVLKRSTCHYSTIVFDF